MSEDTNGPARSEPQHIQLRIMSYAEIYQASPKRAGVKLVVTGDRPDGTMFRLGDVDISADMNLSGVWEIVMAQLDQRLRDLKLLPPKSNIEIVKPSPATPVMLDRLRNGRGQ